MRFLLVDRLNPSEDAMQGVKLAAMSEDYFEWHFPDRPIVPGVLILEAAVQSAGWWAASQTDFESWFLLDRVQTARFYAFAVPGHRIDLHVRAKDTDDVARRRYEVDCTVDGERSAMFEFEGALVPLSDLMDPAAARRTYGQLARIEGEA